MRIFFLLAIILLTPVFGAAQTIEVFGVTGAGQVWDDEGNIGVGVPVGAGIGFRSPQGWGIEALFERERAERNFASGVLPESMNYPHEGVGWDHDSVGIFQQRPSSGWGTVANLMRPAYAAEQFYRALAKVPNWWTMALTQAAQAVQVSAYPYAYAKHEARATQVVGADSFRAGHIVERLAQDVRALELFAGRTEALREAVALETLPRT